MLGLYRIHTLQLLEHGEKDTQSFLFKEYLHVADKPGQFGGLVPEVLIPLALVWIIVLGVAFKGVKKESKLLTVYLFLY